ncbi:MAG: hypothetical protein L0Z54_03310, partial [Thermoplasmata archaeon]|nr:hypothetical protein [Thermoplasmata archaeon]
MPETPVPEDQAGAAGDPADEGGPTQDPVEGRRVRASRDGAGPSALDGADEGNGAGGHGDDVHGAADGAGTYVPGAPSEPAEGGQGGRDAGGEPSPEDGGGAVTRPGMEGEGPEVPAIAIPTAVQTVEPGLSEEELKERDRVRIEDLLEGLTGDDIEELKKKRRKAEKEMLRFMEKRNSLNLEAKRWSGVRDEYNAKVRDLLQQASGHKHKRDETNREVRESKDARYTYNTMVKDLDHEIRALKKKLLPKDADSLAKLKREQRGLEFKQMTSVLTAEKERDLVNMLAAVTARIREIEQVVEQNEEIKAKKQALIDAKEKAEEAHRKVSHLADVAQVEHDTMIELYSKIDELREVADSAQEKFVEAKTQADEAHAN